MRTRLQAILIFLVCTTLACKAATRVLDWSAPVRLTPTMPVADTPSSVPQPQPVQPLPLETPFWAATPTVQPVPLVSPTVAALPTIAPTPSALQLRVFETLWRTVRDEYLYRDFNGLDWEAVHSEYQQRIQAGLLPADFYAAMAEMIDRLQDDHSVFMSPEEAQASDQELTGDFSYVGIGVMTEVVKERRRITITGVFEDSPAEEAGLKLHDNILEVDGQSILDEQGQRRNTLRGPEGTQVTITVQSPGQAPHQMTLTRRRVKTSMPVPYQVFTSPSGKQIGYILIPTFDEQSVDLKVREALRAMTTGRRLDGLILDNRINPGGINTVVEKILGYFVNGQVGKFVNRQEELAVRVQGHDVGGSQKIPLVVLVGRQTQSFGEIFAGILQDQGRATVIGEKTEGNVEILYIYNQEDGSRLLLAHDTFRPAHHPEVDWNQTGIVPEIISVSNWDEVTLETDPVIRTAVESFD